MDGPVVYAAKRRCCLKMAKASHERQRLFSVLFGKPNRVHEKNSTQGIVFHEFRAQQAGADYPAQPPVAGYFP